MFEKGEIMRTVLTIIGEDKVGIIARVASVLSQANANILDLNQTVMREYFTMIMLVDMTDMTVSLEEIKERMAVVEKDLGLSIRIQREEIFKKMHEI
jgi:ACT domain-containing protein